MPETSVINPEVIERSMDKARAELKTYIYKGKGFFAHLTDRDDSTIPMPTEGAFHSYKSVELFLGTFLAFKETLSRERAFQTFQSSNDYDTFINMYASYAGSIQSLEYLNQYYHQAVLAIDDEHLLNLRNESVAGNIIQQYLEKTEMLRSKMGSGRKLAHQTKSFFEWLLKNIIKWAELDRFKHYVYAAQDTHIQIDKKIISGFSWNIHKEDIITVPISFSTLIGVEEAAQKLERYAKQLFLYDPNERVNIEASTIPRTILLYSHPGTGKSSLIHIMIQLMKMYEQNTRKPFHPVFVDNTIKNMYHGESVKNLVQLLEKATDPSGIGLIVIDDIDMILQSRDDPSANHSEIQLVAELMNYISGVKTNNYLGNHINIFTTNAPSRLDPALINDRIEECIYVKGPTTEQEYDCMLHELLKEWFEKKMIASETVCSEIARICEKEKLSGRQVKNIAKLIQKKIIYEGPSIELCTLNPIAQAEIRINQYKKLSSEEIITIARSSIVEFKKAQEFTLHNMRNEAVS